MKKEICVVVQPEKRATRGNVKCFRCVQVSSVEQKAGGGGGGVCGIGVRACDID